MFVRFSSNDFIFRVTLQYVRLASSIPIHLFHISPTYLPPRRPLSLPDLTFAFFARFFNEGHCPPLDSITQCTAWKRSYPGSFAFQPADLSELTVDLPAPRSYFSLGLFSTIAGLLSIQLSVNLPCWFEGCLNYRCRSVSITFLGWKH